MECCRFSGRATASEWPSSSINCCPECGAQPTVATALSTQVMPNPQEFPVHLVLVVGSAEHLHQEAVPKAGRKPMRRPVVDR